MNCKFCNREINNAGSLKSHELSCRQNPDRITHPHSPSAGVKVGNVPWNKGTKTGRMEIWKAKYPDESVFVENSTYRRASLKTRILDDGLIDYKCQCCGIGPEWQGNPMPLILDHINGVNNDNRIENLRFVCSNCDTQLPTYKSKNRKK